VYVLGTDAATLRVVAITVGALHVIFLSCRFRCRPSGRLPKGTSDTGRTPHPLKAERPPVVTRRRETHERKTGCLFSGYQGGLTAPLLKALLRWSFSSSGAYDNGVTVAAW
jgi:diadenosine tetraphosphatase ApaH/serine/threonine PP2A family protein phosphatase